MRSFDLTFNGAVLPDRDPMQVRQDLARLFAIEDSDLIERLFSGETVILRHNLDRKAAADYFRKISLLGGKVALVKSPKHRAVHGDELLLPEVHLDPMAQEVPALEAAPEIAAVDNAGEHDEGGQPAPDAVKIEALAAEASALARRKEASLQRQREQYDRIAAEELEKLEQLSRANRANAEEEIAALGTSAETALQTASSEIAGFEEQKAACRDRSEQSVARLAQMLARREADETASTDDIDARVEEVRESSATEIQRLEQLLAETKRRTEEDIANLEQVRRDILDKSSAEKASLETQRDQALNDCAEALMALEEQEATARNRLESLSAEFEQREQDIRDREREESQRIEAMKKDIEARRDQGIAGVEQALDLLRQEARGSLEESSAADPRNLTLQVQECKAVGSGSP